MRHSAAISDNLIVWAGWSKSVNAVVRHDFGSSRTSRQPHLNSLKQQVIIWRTFSAIHIHHSTLNFLGRNALLAQKLYHTPIHMLEIMRGCHVWLANAKRQQTPSSILWPCLPGWMSWPKDIEVQCPTCGYSWVTKLFDRPLYFAQIIVRASEVPLHRTLREDPRWHKIFSEWGWRNVKVCRHLTAIYASTAVGQQCRNFVHSPSILVCHFLIPLKINKCKVCRDFV